MEPTKVKELSVAENQAQRRWSLSNVPLTFHVLAFSWIAVMLLLARYRPAQYADLLQEDRPIEWATMWLFAAAAVIHLRRAIRQRLFFDMLVAAFCLLVAGEEISWGQRLIGYGSPEYFLANNSQQEVNLHNLSGAVVTPKWILIVVLIGYGILLPVLARSNRLSEFMKRIGATPPPSPLAPWFAVAAGLLVWYPVTLTGEWVETLAGGLFVASIPLMAGTPLIVLSLALIFGVVMTHISNRIEHQRNSERIECATKEIKALLDDLTLGDLGTDKLKDQVTLHERVWTAISEGYINRQAARNFDATSCTSDQSQDRRSYMVDPWGASYWISVRALDEVRQLVVIYSFGPNRRRDGSPDTPTDDDISARGYRRLESQPHGQP